MVANAMPLVMNTMARGNPRGSQVLSGSLESATAYSELFLCVRKTCSAHGVIGGSGLIFWPTLDPQKPVRSRLGAAPPVPSAANLSRMLALPSRRGGGGSVCCWAAAYDAKIRIPDRLMND